MNRYAILSMSDPMGGDEAAGRLFKGPSRTADARRGALRFEGELR